MRVVLAALSCAAAIRHHDTGRHGASLKQPLDLNRCISFVEGVMARHSLHDDAGFEYEMTNDCHEMALPGVVCPTFVNRLVSARGSTKRIEDWCKDYSVYTLTGRIPSWLFATEEGGAPDRVGFFASISNSRMTLLTAAIMILVLLFCLILVLKRSTGRLEVRVVRAENLPAKEKCVVVLTVDGNTATTKPQDGKLSPVWAEMFTLDVSNPKNAVLKAEVQADGESVGFLEIAVADLPEKNARKGAQRSAVIKQQLQGAASGTTLELEVAFATEATNEQKA